MKKALFFLVLALVAVLLAAPWFFGSFTERHIEERLAVRGETDPGIAIVTEEYRRHWFSSDSRHRIVLTDPEIARALGELAGGEPFGDQPAVVVETRIEHGPLPAGDDGGPSFAPGLSRAVSTFRLDPGSGAASIPLPGRLVTAMALDGSTDAVFTLEAGARPLADGGMLEWEGARVEGELDADGRTVRASGQVRPFRLTNAADGGHGAGVAVGMIDFESEQRYTQYGIPVGAAAAEIAKLAVEDASGRYALEGIRITTDSEITEALLSGTTEFRVDRIVAGDGAPLSLTLDMAVRNLDAHSLAALIETTRRVQNTAPALPPEDAWPLLEPDVAQLVAAGPVLDIRDLVIGLPEGEARLTSYVALAAGGDAAPPLQANELIGRLTATLDVRLPRALLASIATAVPAYAGELEMLIAMGVLRKDGEDYRLEAEYGNRLLTVNGLPVPVPLGL